MYLLWYMILILMIAYSMNVFCKISFENSVAIGQLGILVFLYLCYLIDVLKAGIYFTKGILAIFFIASVIITIRHKKVKTTFKNVLSIPAGIYAGYLMLTYITVRDKVPFWGDELLYWAALPKVLYKYNGALQIRNGFQLFAVDYTPGSSIYGYFLQEMNGSWNDSLLFFGYAAITGALLLPITKNVKKWKTTALSIAALYMIPLFFFHTKANDYAIFYQSLYIDPVLGVSAGCLAWVFMQKPWKNKALFLQFILYLSFVALIKSSGIVFVLIVNIAMLIYLISYDRKILHKWWIWFGTTCPVLLWGLWNLALEFYQIDRVHEYSITSFLDLSIIKTFVIALINKKVFVGWFDKIIPGFSFVFCFLILSVLVTWLFHTQYAQNKERIKIMQFTYIMILLQSVVFVIGLYGLCVKNFNGNLSSYERYISTVLEMIICFFFCTLFSEWDALFPVIKRQRKRISYFVGFLCILIAPLKHVNNTANTYPDYIIEDRLAVSSIFKEISGEIEPDSWKSVVFIYNEPDWKDSYASWVGWAKGWYGHLRNNISYESITQGIQVRTKNYYDSQMKIDFLEMGGALCTLTDEDNWMEDIDYILMLHGNYVETPIHNWELYKVGNLEGKQLFLEYVAAGNKPEEFINYH